MSGTHAARHLKLKPATWRQHAHRSGMKPEEFTWWQLRQMRVAKSFEDATAPFDWRAPVMAVLPARSSQTLTAAVVLSLLESLFRGTSVQVLGLRFGVPSESMNRMIEETMTICHHLGQVSWSRKFDAQSARPVDVVQALRMAGLDLARAHQKKFQNLKDFLSQEQAMPLLQQACTSWQICRRRGVVSLDRYGEVLGLYKLLQEAKVDPLNLRICVRSSTQDAQQISDREIKAALGRRLVAQGARDDFCSVFGVFPHESDRQIRADQPSIYLQWDEPAHRMTPSSASSSCAGLDAWMIAVSVLLTI